MINENIILNCYFCHLYLDNEEEDDEEEDDEEEDVIISTSGRREIEVSKSFDTNRIQVFGITPFTDDVSEEFKLKCDIGNFKIGKNIMYNFCYA